jgi:hypothetical protein
MDDGYEKALDMLHETINNIGREGVTKSTMLSALTDLAVMLGLIIEGEAGTYTMIDNMKKSTRRRTPVTMTNLSGVTEAIARQLSTHRSRRCAKTLFPNRDLRPS